MRTAINGQATAWTPEIWEQWQAFTAAVADPDVTGDLGGVNYCNYFTPRPYVDEYNRGLHNIDVMDDSPELAAAGKYYESSSRQTWCTPEQALELPGYLRDVATECLQEAGWVPPKAVYCRHARCKYWHVVPQPDQPQQLDARYCAQHQPKVQV